MKATAAVVLSCVLISSAGAETNEISANYKLPGCRDFIAIPGNPQLNRVLVQDSARLYRATLCGGEMDGIANTLQVMGQICWPYGVTGAQIDAVVMNYIERIPERHHESFTVLAIEALKRAWPCRR
jgi:Rap1a immunity proteins